jgi:eukaryotic-like serine/threonine-protein kinase
MVANKEPNEKSIFLQAIAIATDEERADYLQSACAGNEALRVEIEALLRAHARPQHILDAPDVGSPPLDQPPLEKPGTQIGPYKLLQEIGQGGMGVVYMAEQTEPVERRVALKIIKPGMDSPQVIARFEAEEQTLAMMDHPNIAKVFDAGVTDSGRPYFVMELVRGVPITQFCDEHRITPRERLELFVPACHAIQHAHQKGIIHRDIKPTNVLVAEYDDRPVPKIIDFGVAKAVQQRVTERTMFTQFGQVVGTMDYMSPEQAKLNELDIDTRSDIYSLGVLLYELLTGETPFDRQRLRSAAFDELLRIIREEEPPRPSTRLSSSESLPSIAANRQTEPKRLSTLMRGDLDWIVMKALEKERSRRYETANAFAADVQRYLSDEPVQACPPSAAYRLQKFVRRNKGPVAAVCLLLLALVGGTLGTTVGLVRAERACSAETERANAERQAKEAERKAKETAEAREAETQAVLDFVENKVFAAARPEGLEGGLGREVTLRKAVEGALRFVENSFADKPLIEARLRRTLGRSFECLGEAKIAAEQCERARRLYAKHLGADHLYTLRSMLGLANCYQQLGQNAEALKLGEETLALQKTKLGPDHPDTLLGMNNLANTYAQLGQNAEALKLREETLVLMKTKLGRDHPYTFMSMNNLANSYNRVGRYAEAATLHEEVLARKRVLLGSDHPDTLTSMHNLANSYDGLGRHAEALELNEEILALRAAILGPDHPDTLKSMESLASSYDWLDRHTEALKLHEETLRIREAKLGPNHPATLHSMLELAITYDACGRHTEALQLREQTLPLMKAKLGPDDPDTLKCMHGLAYSYGQLNRPAEAVELLRETLALREAKSDHDDPDTLKCMWGMADGLVKLDRGAEAVPVIDECVQRATGKVVDPGMIPYLMVLRLRHFEKAKDAAGCRNTAEMWERLKRTDVGSLYDAACMRAVTAAVICASDKTQTAAQDAAAEAEQAMAWLRQAVAAGYKDDAHLKNDQDLGALRDREDFKTLIAELEKGKERDAK